MAASPGALVAARPGAALASGPQLLDVLLVLHGRVVDGGDVKVGLATPASELDLAKEGVGSLGLALDGGVPVANVVVGEGHNGLLLVADGDGGNGPAVLVAGEGDGADLVVKSPEGDGGSAGHGGRAEETEESGSELHFDSVVLLYWLNQVIKIVSDCKSLVMIE